MKMYFFSRRGWGLCYTVLAHTRYEAKKAVVNHLRKAKERDMEQVESIWARNKDKDIHLENAKKRWEEELDIDSSYDIEEFKEGEVLETEYS